MQSTRRRRTAMMRTTTKALLLDGELELPEIPIKMELWTLKRLTPLKVPRPVVPAARSPPPNVKHRTKKAISNPRKRDPTMTMALIPPSPLAHRASLARPAMRTRRTAAPLVVVPAYVSALPNPAVTQKLPMNLLKNLTTCEVAGRNAAPCMKSFLRNHAAVARKLIIALFDPNTFCLLKMSRMTLSPNLPLVVDAAEVVAAGSELFSRHMDLSAVVAHRLS
jgi:hypothetical protein